MLSNSAIIGVALIAISFYYSMRSGSNVDNGLSSGTDGLGTAASQIANAWEKIIEDGVHGADFKKKSRIAVGVNVNADLIVSGTDVLRKLGILPTGRAKDNSALNSLADLEETFAYSLSNGAAVERTFSKGEVFDKVVKAADSIENKEYFIGGNAALAGLGMASSWKNLQVLMIGPCGPRVRALLPSNVVIPETSVMATDEVHLIMEFRRHEVWGDHKAAVATRFITSHDISNSEMTGLADFVKSVLAFSPDAVFFSGLHLLDGQPEMKIEEKLDALRLELSKLPLQLPVHLELASMADPKLIKPIYEKVISCVHSLGLNEQELTLLSATNSGPHPELYIREGYPEVGAVADVLHWILSSGKGGYQTGGKSPTLTRVHFHSLAFHIVATIRDTWINSATAVSAGARIAGRQACDDRTIMEEKVELRVPQRFALSINHPELRQTIVSIDPSDPVISWTRDNIEFHLTPVLVCKNPVKTVGLGDAISSTGFLYSQMVSAS